MQVDPEHVSRVLSLPRFFSKYIFPQIYIYSFLLPRMARLHTLGLHHQREDFRVVTNQSTPSSAAFCQCQCHQLPPGESGSRGGRPKLSDLSSSQSWERAPWADYQISRQGEKMRRHENLTSISFHSDAGPDQLWCEPSLSNHPQPRTLQAGGFEVWFLNIIFFVVNYQ